MPKKSAIRVLFALISTSRSQFFPKSDQFIMSRCRKNTIYVINQCIFTYKLYEDFWFSCFLSGILTTVCSKKILNFSFRPKIHRFRLILQKLNSKGFFRPLVETHLFKIQFPTKKFLTKFFIKMHRFRLIHQKLNSKGFFRPLVETHLFKIQFATINFVAKFFIKPHRIRIFHQ